MALAHMQFDGAEWHGTALTSRLAEGMLNAPYLCTFLKHHEMPSSRQRLNTLNGPRLWQQCMLLVPGELRAGTAVQIRGVMPLVMAFNHGFCAPTYAQRRLLEFMRGVDADEAWALEQHYVACSGFRMPMSQLGSPPTHLDFFKDERVRKSWRQWSGLPMVLLHANELLRAWPDLMQPSWEAVNAARDCAAIWEACQLDITELHRNVDAEGERAKLW